jgi:hypothetical protein
VSCMQVHLQEIVRVEASSHREAAAAQLRKVDLKPELFSEARMVRSSPKVLASEGSSPLPIGFPRTLYTLLFWSLGWHLWSAVPAKACRGL